MRITPLSQHVGAEISGVDLNDLDDGTVAEIRQVWLDHGVEDGAHRRIRQERAVGVPAVGAHTDG